LPAVTTETGYSTAARVSSLARPFRRYSLEAPATMKFRRQLAPIILLAIPTLSTALATSEKAGTVSQLAQEPAAQADQNGEVPFTIKDVGTKDAPVDGLDGKPHAGPFVESTQRKKPPAVAEDLGPGNKPVKQEVVGPADGSPSSKKRLSDLKPEDPAGTVMGDGSRVKPKKGTTGTEGGVSEKTQVQEQKELAGKSEPKTPEKPKEAPPLPASAKISKEKVDKIGNKKDASGLEVCVLNHSDFQHLNLQFRHFDLQLIEYDCRNQMVSPRSRMMFRNRFLLV